MTPAKRAFDLFWTILGLAVLAPLFLVIALLIKVSDGGPVFFRQERVGRRGQPFRLWKFRTMVVNGETAGTQLTVGRDPRVTRIGRWLRKLKLDELPQLLNVLAGDMTLVGPRPEVPHYSAFYTLEQRRVLEFTPGVTDPASVKYRNESDMLAQAGNPEQAYVERILPDKIQISLSYATRATIWSDVVVILDTIRYLIAATLDLPSILILRFRRPVIVAVHVVLVVVGYYLAFQLRFDFRLPHEYLPLFWRTLPFLVVLRLLAFAYYGLHRGYWRHVGIEDLLDLGKAVTLSSLSFVVALFATGTLAGMPRSVLALDWVVAIFLSGGVRFAARWLQEGQVPWGRPHGKRTLIVGAGEAAEQLVRQFRHDGRRSAVRIIGLVDDDPAKQRVSLHGARVLGTCRDLGWLTLRHRIELLVIAMPSASGEQIRQIVRRCMSTGIEFKILPPLRDLLKSRVRLGKLRNVQLEDMLGRPPVTLDLSAVERDLSGHVVVVTGAAGSIGAELGRQVARFRPSRLLLLDQAESPLYFLQLELTQAYPDLDIVPIVGDITDEARVEEVFGTYRPEYIFHAAAYKHVPMMESNPAEAVRNNVLGTLLLAQTAARLGAKRFVLISTDKAVNPSSIMGATKRIAERVVLGLPALRATPTDFRVVRFGNVLGSNGSVVPLFRQQLAAGGPLTVTHPEVTRYFMIIPEAVQLVLKAAALPEAAGRIALLEMGQPIRIADLAENLIRLSGLEPYSDVQIRFVGLRPGEKLHEELTSEVERTVPTSVEKVRVMERNESSGAAIEQGIIGLSAALAFGGRERLLAEIAALVPECVGPLRDTIRAAVPADSEALAASS